MRKLMILTLMFFLATNFTTLTAQELEAKKYEDPTWVRIVQLKFKPMKMEPAMEIINDYFDKADQNAGIKSPTAYHLVSGNYDMLVIWELEEGIETLNYEMSPDDVRWMTEMGKLTGGMEQTMTKLEEFYSYVDGWETELARAAE